MLQCMAMHRYVSTKKGRDLWWPGYHAWEESKKNENWSAIVPVILSCPLLKQRQYKNDPMESKCMLVLNFAAFFSSWYRRVQKRGNFKTNILFDSIKSFLYSLSSSAIALPSSSRHEWPEWPSGGQWATRQPLLEFFLPCYRGHFASFSKMRIQPIGLGLTSTFPHS